MSLDTMENRKVMAKSCRSTGVSHLFLVSVLCHFFFLKPLLKGLLLLLLLNATAPSQNLSSVHSSAGSILLYKLPLFDCVQTDVNSKPRKLESL